MHQKWQTCKESAGLPKVKAFRDWVMAELAKR